MNRDLNYSLKINLFIYDLYLFIYLFMINLLYYILFIFYSLYLLI